jgi:murein DD-endopeptidase MepM/ murein hydrolase activator NlpD
VVTTAFIGAGVVAIGTQFAMPSSTVDPSALAAINGGGQSDVVARQQQADADRASRSNPDAQINSALDAAASKLWLLPLPGGYKVSEPFGPAGHVMRQGCELSAPEGSPFVASHDGTVVFARYAGALGYAATLDLGNGIELVYGHAGKLVVHEGQKVRAGDVLGLVGDTGVSWGPSLYFAIEVNGNAVNPATFLNQYGLNFASGRDDVYAG